MTHQGRSPVKYRLGDIDISSYIGSSIRLKFLLRLECVDCGRATKKTFAQGYCYPCFRKLAACDLCILKPELCHYRHGTCREPEWGEKHCLIPHVVYLANSSGLKVGITRAHQKFTRWGDQGASAAIVIAEVPERHLAGLIEVALKGHISDKTDWRKLIKGEAVGVDLAKEKQRLTKLIPDELQKYVVDGAGHDEIYELKYLVLNYPEKAVTHQPLKKPEIEGKLQGVKGQYLFIGDRALNIRKYQGHQVSFDSL